VTGRRSFTACVAPSEADTDYDRALEQLELVNELEHTHPGAAASLREGVDETLTVTRLPAQADPGEHGACESMIDCVRTTQRNVKCWSSGEMGLRWTDAGMLEAEKQFRKMIGYLQLPQLAIAIERRLHLPPAQPEPGGRHRSHCVTITPRPPSPKSHGERDNLPSQPPEHWRPFLSGEHQRREDHSCSAVW
jgi:hypothetical protein